ncbi:hypothetical protein [Azospirillum halopraeferens]|uniref:hypothetical protein n=1 Tax=Azospirillum halopraeferens TaxID=34010 RepID=UPI0012EC58F2|nr:hypothetical protein [Azospirillum halopraeferens]
MSAVSQGGAVSGVEVGTWSCVARVDRVGRRHEMAGATIFESIAIGNADGRTATLTEMSAGNAVAACLVEGATVELWVVSIESGGTRGGIIYAARPVGAEAAASEPGEGTTGLVQDLSLVRLFAAAARDRAKRQMIVGVLLLPVVVGALFIRAGLRSRRLAALVPPVDALRANLPA